MIPEAVPMGLQTVRNRQATGWWTEEQIIGAYHGLDSDITEPLPWTWELAWDAMCNLGNPHGYLFVLSKHDMRNRPSTGYTICNGNWCATFLKEFPKYKCHSH